MRQQTLVALAALMAWALTGCGNGGGTMPSGGPGVARIDPQADAALKRMSHALAEAKVISFKSRSTMDESLESGQLASFSRTSSIVMHRPDKLHVQSQRGQRTWMLWYRGTKLTILDAANKCYATVDVPDRIDKMFDFMADNYGMVVPLADFLFPDPYVVLTDDALKGELVRQHKWHGKMCDHLLITEENIDWQIWIDCGNPPVPRKLALDYKTRPGRPQFVAVFSDWVLSSSIDDTIFDPELPKDAKKVDMAELLKAREGD